jgi:hypothetical protein
VKHRRFVVVIIAVATVASWRGTADQTPAPRGDSLILITLDGARTQEIFGGLDVEVLRSTLPKAATVENHPLYKRFYAATPEARRERLLPFFWTELMTRHGSIAGNPRRGSVVRVSNGHRFSYPGYSEILVGRADDQVIRSNDRVQNPHRTVLEGLKAQLRLPAAQVAVFASWEVFNEIVEQQPGALTVNAGYEAFEGGSVIVGDFSRLQFETPTPWNSVRHDVYTFRLAMAHLAAARPRVLYLALGETDDWAHDGRYDRVLETFARTDGYLGELWTWLQSQADYRDRTHLLITTDHGRGRTVADWRNHGAKVDGAEDTWMAFISPRLARRGEWSEQGPIWSSQAAATMASWMGLDWRAAYPEARAPVAGATEDAR